MMVHSRISIDNLIAIVAKGGKVKTGIDVYNSKGVLLLEKNVLVNSVKTLETIKAQGVRTLPLNPENYGGIWDEEGNYLKIDADGVLATDSPEIEKSSKQTGNSKTGAKTDLSAQKVDKTKKEAQTKKNRNLSPSGELEKRLKTIEDLKIVAAQQYDLAKQRVKKTCDEIKKSGGEFDYDDVEKHVTEMVSFFNSVTENPFAYLTKEILNYDNFLYSHAVNVCAIGTAILNRFNSSFSSMVNRHIDTSLPAGDELLISSGSMSSGSYVCYLKDEIVDISTGFFLHDIGKVLIPEGVLNKKNRLTVMEFDMIKKHSYGLGVKILEKNRIKNSVIKNIVSLHHAGLFDGEKSGYPENIHPDEIPLSVKICKLADMYDAMTSRRAYREAFNPINTVTDIFRKYAKKDKMLQFILHAFVKSIGIYPTGSVIYLKNGQLAYVLESIGPLVLPFTDAQGNILSSSASPVDLADNNVDDELKADGFRSIKTPLEVYDLLPSWLKPLHPSATS
ncbi:MAG: HD domain-containing protein [Desulfamplus sp.]|nr:HD domain-containing protein [Desulfamplus sp.]MBF0259006.1 HD domain-containing protein [Desulfamplus sp.]